MREIELVRSLPERVRVGDPIASGPLALVPVFGGVAAPSYALAADAIAAGTLSIGETGGGQVPMLAVGNAGDLPVLLVEGEHLEGVMQDRVLNVTVLVPPRSETRIPVSCVEHGRWGYRSGRRFAPSPEFAHTRLRAEKTAAVAARRRTVGDRAGDQGAVWAEVERKRTQMGAVSPTAAMRDTFAQRAGDLDCIVGDLATPRPGQTGVVVCVAGSAVAFDGFDRAETLAALWPRLVRGYAMEALGGPSRPIAAGAATAFLERVTSGEASSHGGVGLGTEVVVTGPGSVASALVWQDSVIHLAAFGSAEQGSRRAAVIERPSRRTRAKTWFHDGGDGGGR
jgi:hypothetical protein